MAAIPQFRGPRKTEATQPTTTSSQNQPSPVRGKYADRFVAPLPVHQEGPSSLSLSLSLSHTHTHTHTQPLSLSKSPRSLCQGLWLTQTIYLTHQHSRIQIREGLTDLSELIEDDPTFNKGQMRDIPGLSRPAPQPAAAEAQPQAKPRTTKELPNDEDEDFDPVSSYWYS